MPTRPLKNLTGVYNDPNEDAQRLGVQNQAGSGNVDSALSYEQARINTPQQVIPWYQYSHDAWTPPEGYEPITRPGGKIIGYKPTGTIDQQHQVYMIGPQRDPFPGEWGYDPSMEDDGTGIADFFRFETALAGALGAGTALGSAGGAGAGAESGISTTPLAETSVGVPVETAGGGLTAGEVAAGAGGGVGGGSSLSGSSGASSGASIPTASQADVADFGLGGAEYGGYQPTSYASSVGGATGGGGMNWQNLMKNALQGQSNAAASADPGMRQKLTHLLAPASLNPVAGAEGGGQSQPADPYAPQQFGAYGAPYMQALKRQMLAKSLAGGDEYGEL